MPRKHSDVPRFLTILAIVIATLSVILSFALYQQLSSMQKEVDDAEGLVEEEKKSYNLVFDQNVKAARLILNEGRLDDERIKRIEELVKDAQGVIEESTGDYLQALLGELKFELEKKSNAAQDAIAKRDLAQNLLDQERIAKETAVQNLEMQKKEVESELERIRTDMKEVQAKHREEVETLKGGFEERYQEWKTALGEKTTALGTEKDKVVELEKELDVIKNPPPPPHVEVVPKKRYQDERELADGRVVRADNKLRLAVIDIGRAEGVKRGLKFNVFRDGGVSKRHLKGQIIVKKVYENVSEAFISYQRGVGQSFFLTGNFSDPPQEKVIESIKSAGGGIAGEFGPDVDYLVVGKSPDTAILDQAQTSRVPVLREHQVESFLSSPDTIRSGDVIMNPAFSTTKKEQFFLFGEFATPRALLLQRIAQYGSQVAEDVSPATDYLVVGARGLPEEKEQVYDKANKLGITVMREEELLAFLVD